MCTDTKSHRMIPFPSEIEFNGQRTGLPGEIDRYRNYYYFKSDYDCITATKNHHCMVCKLPIPPSFYHLNENFEPIGKEIGPLDSNLLFLVNIIPTDYLEDKFNSFYPIVNQSLTLKYLINNLVACGNTVDDKPGECRAGLKSCKGKPNKVFCTKKEDGSVEHYYVPTLGEIKNGATFSEVIYFKTNSKDQLRNWLPCPSSIDQGIAQDGDAIISEETISGVTINVSSDSERFQYRGGCNSSFEISDDPQI